MATGSDLVDLAKQHLGEQYVFGADVPKDDSDWAGPWDCAEFISWVVYQAIEKLYGCDNNSGNPAKENVYTGYWQRAGTAEKVKRVSVEEAAQSPGAILLRYPSRGATEHIVFVSGPNKTVEAHSTKDGVIESVISGRRWDCGVLVPGITYDSDVQSDPADSSTPEAPTPITQSLVYRLKTPHMKGEVVRAILAIEPPKWWPNSRFHKEWFLTAKLAERPRSCWESHSIEPGPHTIFLLGLCGSGSVTRRSMGGSRSNRVEGSLIHPANS